MAAPQSIEEFIHLCEEKNVPYRKMRFMLGEDCREPECFGIYKDKETGEFVVYKNRSDGVRKERYRGVNEAYAVSLIYQKMDEEIVKRRMNKPADRPLQKDSPARHSGKKKAGTVLATVAAVVAISAGALGLVHQLRKKQGYYKDADNGMYYHLDDDWYYWNDSGWYPYYEDVGDWEYLGSDYEPEYSDYGVWEDFSDTGYYEEDVNEHSYEDHHDEYSHEDHDDYDDDWSSDDFDDWDSGDTDWDSDW